LIWGIRTPLLNNFAFLSRSSRSKTPASSGPPPVEVHRSDPQRRSIRRQPRIEQRQGGRGGDGEGDGFDEEGIFHFNENEEDKPSRRKK
jgi:hypothetical protein